MGQGKEFGSRVALDVATLRALFRNFQAFRSLYETEGIDTITDPDGVEWHLLDLEYLYEQLPLLPQRQHQAIELCFIQNLKEAEAAVAMGVSYTNPVSIYANNGLSKLIAMIEAGRLPRFHASIRIEIDLTEGRQGAADERQWPEDAMSSGPCLRPGEHLPRQGWSSPMSPLSPGESRAPTAASG